MKHLELITEAIEEEFVVSYNKAINNPENRGPQDTLIWDYVNADMHLDLKHEFKHDDINFAFELLTDIFMECV